MSVPYNDFVDEVTLEVGSGHGGAGSVSFRREKYIERGGPDGGDGGAGGHLIFQRSDRLRTLSHLRGKTTLKAKNGGQGMGKRRFGLNGADMIIEVPPGSVIKNADTDEVLFDFFTMSEVETYRCLEGGKGGKGNWHFRTSRQQVPRYAQPGLEGTLLNVRIEMSLIADVGLVGLPNAGKSTLLNTITNAHSKVAAYPFTTKIPYLGVLRLYDHDIILADIPGLIEGAHLGKGLGLQFLKHISRTNIIAYVIDFSQEDIEGAYAVLQNELAEYSDTLTNKTFCVLATKMDLEISQENWKIWQEKHQDIPMLALSSFSGEGIKELPPLLDALITKNNAL